MLTYITAYNDLKAALTGLYDAREATAIAGEVIEHITGAGRLQRIIDKDKILTMEESQDLHRLKDLLLKGTPLQYVLGFAWFLGEQYVVNEHVLIPRPETEELVEWVVAESGGNVESILDIGSGSGCIPVSLKLKLSYASVTSVDISTNALSVARQNAINIGADVDFVEFDFLNTTSWSELSSYDIIVSNPPYIPESERQSLHSNVRDFEPGTALFIPDADALLFYRHIARFGKEHLSSGGLIYCELHMDYAQETELMFRQEGYMYTELRKDMHGNMRMLKVGDYRN